MGKVVENSFMSKSGTQSEGGKVQVSIKSSTTPSTPCDLGQCPFSDIDSVVVHSFLIVTSIMYVDFVVVDPNSVVYFVMSGIIFAEEKNRQKLIA